VAAWQKLAAAEVEAVLELTLGAQEGVEEEALPTSSLR